MLLPISFQPELIFNLDSFPITNSLLVSWLVMIILAIAAYFSTRRMTMAPQKLQNIAEAAMEALLGLIQSVTNDKNQSLKFFPVVATIFLFVLFANWAGLIPGVGTIGFLHHGPENETEVIPFLRPPSSDLNFTFALAIISVISAQIFGIAALGFFKYAGRFINLKSPISFFVGILELISELAKLISFSFRLFGNIFAGEVILIVISFLIPFAAPLPFYLLEILVGFLQAFIFSMLTLVFLKLATTTEH